MTTEEWKPVPIPPHDKRYAVSNLGRVQNIERCRVLIPKMHTGGYRQVCLSSLPAQHYVYIHRLVYVAFVHQVPDGMLIDHIDNDKTNNCLDNLQLVTPSENNALASADGLLGKKLAPDDVREIRRLLSGGKLLQREIGERFNVDQRTTSAIKCGILGRYII